MKAKAMQKKYFDALTFELSNTINVLHPIKTGEMILVFEVDDFNYQTGRSAVIKVLEGTADDNFQIYAAPRRITIQLLEIIEPTQGKND